MTFQRNATRRSQPAECPDWRIGHGLTDVDAAVALARTLQLMRNEDNDGIVDHPEYNVWDAYEIDSMMTTTTIPANTDRVRHFAWKGDWNHFNNGQTGAVYYTEDSHYVWIHNGTARLEATFTATEVDLDTGKGALQLAIDLGDDGSNDAQGGATASLIHGITTSPWTDLRGAGGLTSMFLGRPWSSLQGFLGDIEFFESRSPYTVDVMLTMDLNQPVNGNSNNAQLHFGFESDHAFKYENDTEDGMLTFTEPPTTKPPSFP